jgi:hypothetical protein
MYKYHAVDQTLGEKGKGKAKGPGNAIQEPEVGGKSTLVTTRTISVSELVCCSNWREKGERYHPMTETS